jgi:hypothetical protein
MDMRVEGTRIGLFVIVRIGDVGDIGTKGCADGVVL